MKRQIDDGPTSRDLGGLFRVGIGGQLPQDASRSSGVRAQFIGRAFQQRFPRFLVLALEDRIPAPAPQGADRDAAGLRDASGTVGWTSKATMAAAGRPTYADELAVEAKPVEGRLTFFFALELVGQNVGCRG